MSAEQAEGDKLGLCFKESSDRLVELSRAAPTW